MGTGGSKVWVWLVGIGFKQLTRPFALGQAEQGMDFGCSWGIRQGGCCSIGCGQLDLELYADQWEGVHTHPQLVGHHSRPGCPRSREGDKGP